MKSDLCFWVMKTNIEDNFLYTIKYKVIVSFKNDHFYRNLHFIKSYFFQFLNLFFLLFYKISKKVKKIS